MNNIPEHYSDFIDAIRFSSKESLNQLQISTLFTLHNHYVDILNPESNTACEDCIQLVWDKVRTHFNLDATVVNESVEIRPEENEDVE